MKAGNSRDGVGEALGVTLSSSAQQHRGSRRPAAGENVWTDPRLGIGQGGAGREGARTRGCPKGMAFPCVSSRWVLPELEEKL